MAVTIGSSGVTFNDSTVQTTAASAVTTTQDLTLISGVNISSSTASFTVTGLDTQVTNNGYQGFLLFSGGWNNTQSNPSLLYSYTNGSDYQYGCGSSENSRNMMQDTSSIVGSDSNTTRCWTNTSDVQAAYTYIYNLGISTIRVAFWTQWWNKARSGAGNTYGWQGGTAAFSTNTINAIQYTFPATTTGRVALYGIKYPTATS